MKSGPTILLPMNDQTDQPVPTPPPIGNAKFADHYIDQLLHLFDLDKATVSHSDLKRYDPGTMQDHYRTVLGDYDVEVSHSIQANNGHNLYIMLFNNLKQIRDGQSAKAILAYIYLSESQFNKFKAGAQEYLDRKRKEAEEKRFKETMQPIDEFIDEAISVHHEESFKQTRETFSSSEETPQPPFNPTLSN